MEKLEVFEVVKPQGIKGELKVRILADSILNVNKIKTLYDKNGNTFTVKLIKDAGAGFAFLSLDGVVTRNDAELLRGVIYYAEKGDIKKTKTSYFITDLIGLSVYSEGEEIGVIKDVLKGNVDMFVLADKDGKTVYIPYLKKLNPIVDLTAKTLTVDGEELKDVIYYES